MTTESHAGETKRLAPAGGRGQGAALVLIAALFIALYWPVWFSLYDTWTLIEGYYTHGFLVPLFSIYVAWHRREAFFATDARPSPLGFPVLGSALLLFVVGRFLGFGVFMELSLIPALVGLSLLLCGGGRTGVLWFSFAFLLFMIPVPASLIQSVAFNLKILAAEASVRLCNALTLPMVREGSYIHFNDDKLLVGAICGGLRSLIALLAFGAFLAYQSKAKPAAQIAIFVLAAPIAVIANIFRIFLLCVVGYFAGADVAAGRVHDVSGYLIFVVAFALFFTVEATLRRFAPASEDAPPVAAPGATPPGRTIFGSSGLRTWVFLLAATLALSIWLGRAEAKALEAAGAQPPLDIPEFIGSFQQSGEDLPIENYVKRVLQTSSILVRPYASPTGYPISLTVVHAGATRRSLHFPEVCLVGAGWEIREQTSVPVGFYLNASKLVLVRGDQSEAVYYWFKTGNKMTGNFFKNAYYWVLNQLTFGARTSTMIKIAAPVGPQGEAAAFAVLDEFSAQFAPVALQRIP